MKKILFLLLLTIGFFFTSHPAFAADSNVTCTSSNCSPSTFPGFFSASEVWYPGKVLTKTIQFTNTASTTQTIDNHAANMLSIGDANVANVIDFTVRRVSTNTIVWFGTLQSFYSAGTVTLGDITSGSSDTYEYTGEMRVTAGNEYQDTYTKFDLVFGVNTADTVTPTPTPCSAQKPATPGNPSLSQFNSSDVHVTWNSVNDPKTGYIVSWGTNTGADNAGSRFTGATDVTVLGLNLGTTRYYFKVQAVNSCATGDFSGVSSIGSGPDLTSSGGGTSTNGTTTAVAGASTQALFASTQTGGSVLGDETTITDETTTPTPKVTPTPTTKRGEVKGAKDCQNVWWWWLIIVGYLLGEIVPLALRHRVPSLTRLLINIAITVVACYLFYITLCLPWPWIFLTIIASIIFQMLFRLIKLYKTKMQPLVKQVPTKSVK